MTVCRYDYKTLFVIEKMKKSSKKSNDLQHLEPLKKIRQIVRYAQKHSAAIEQRCGVNGAQLWLMSELHESPRLRVGDLVSRMAVHQSTVSNLVESLVQKGLVEKTSDERDRRVTLLTLTLAGTRILKKGPTPTRGVLPHALQSMDPGALADLNQSLQALLDTVRGIEQKLGMQLLPFNISAN